MRFFIIITCLMAAISAKAQSGVEDVMASVAANNPTLKVLRERAEAQKLANRSGIMLANPEVEYAHLWGSPSSIGARNDLSVSQQFDLGTVFGIRRRLAASQNNLVEASTDLERVQIMLQAKELCYELIYCNAMLAESETRLADARATASAYSKMLENGSANIIDANKAKINLVQVEAQVESITAQRDAAAAGLQRLAGGNAVGTLGTSFTLTALPADFTSWLQTASERSPELRYASQAIETAQRGIATAKAGSLPTLSAGFMREKVVGEGYQGIKVGVSIPLWENTNRVKQARAEARAAQSAKADTEQQLATALKNLYNKCASLRSTVERYRASALLETAPAMLRKALDEGQISLLDYFNELGYYYSAREELLAAQRDYMQSLAQLNSFEL